ncbi:MAG: urate oxidase, partial [Acidobacteriaceae bacterium]|nr:urate oxidase [Acidobacteriaceae bacterium]
VVEVSVGILFQGALAESYTGGDNRLVLPTDTMKNTIYVLARKQPIESIEEFALRAGDHFLERFAHLSCVTVEIEQVPWQRMGDHGGAFSQGGQERRTTKVTVSRDGKTLQSGIRNLQILKTSGSGFLDFLNDEFTTLAETRDRLLGTVLDADWRLRADKDGIAFNALHREIRNALLEKFASHDSLSVQHTLYAMAEAVIDRFEKVHEIHLVMPNKHCLLFDLARFGLDNPNQIFVPTDEPSGYIEARVRR